MTGPDHPRILPIDIESIKVVLSQKDHDALDKPRAGLFVEADVGEIGGPEPSANRNENCKRGVLLSKSSKNGEVLIIGCKSGDHDPILDVGECIVHARHGVGVDLARLQRSVLGKDVTHHHRLRTGFRRATEALREQQSKETGTGFHERDLSQ